VLEPLAGVGPRREVEKRREWPWFRHTDYQFYRMVARSTTLVGGSDAEVRGDMHAPCA
jgi:hypothetical protein